MVKYKKNPSLSNKKLNTCVSELIDWAYHSRLKRSDKALTEDENTKPFVIGSHISLYREYPTDIHCYSSDLINYLLVDKSILTNYDDSKIKKFILEYITPILLKYKILSISFGSYAYGLNEDTLEYEVVDGAM